VERILISGCLLGQKIRYNGSDKFLANDFLIKWQSEGRLVPICPELAAGFTVPRSPAEIIAIDGSQKVMDIAGRDVTDGFMSGARIALGIAKKHSCRFALLTDGSPSCGSTFIYDGTFSGARLTGSGLTTQLLRANGIEVFAETDIIQLAKEIELLESLAISAGS
jgi:uncharacterized protein YbbK (DUF523 family)